MRASSDPALCATRSPALNDLAWAAGIFEGEGCVHFQSDTVGLTVTQRDPWILVKLRDLFGGRITGPQRSNAKLSPHPIYRWKIYGARARGFLLTIFTWLSPRRRSRARWALGHGAVV